MALSAGARFGAYEIIGPLGAGGMGEVYRAKDPTLEREVALKLLPEAFAVDANRVARFEQEAKTLAALNHPSIAQIHGLEKSGGTTAIVMELVEGTTLAERIAQGPIPADEAKDPAWTPDGQWITYSSNRDGRWRIYRQRADGRGIAEVLTDPAEGKTHTEPAWTPDGEHLAYIENGEGGGDIWIVTVPGGTPELLVGGNSDQFGIAFAPDGQALAYTRANGGSFEVIAEPFPPDGSRARISEEGIMSIWPVWSRNSARLSYQVGTGAFAVVDLDTRDFAIRNRRALPFVSSPTERNLDSMPGDRMLVAAPPLQGGATPAPREIVIVENWIEEVKQRVPRE
jgi:hypothetical protein